jgi:tRNA modification GTPase
MVVNKIDINQSAFGQFFCDSTICQQNFFISARTGAGIGALIEALVEEVAKQLPDKAEVGEVVTNERHRECLVRARDSLAEFLKGASSATAPPEILAADIKHALSALNEVVGRTYTEDILGRIFSKFCVGK